jgi:hypothetical protein
VVAVACTFIAVLRHETAEVYHKSGATLGLLLSECYHEETFGSRRWEDNIKKNTKGVGYECVNSVCLG